MRVYDWAQDPATSSFFLIMECLEGEDAGSLLAREGPLRWRRFVENADQCPGKFGRERHGAALAQPGAASLGRARRGFAAGPTVTPPGTDDDDHEDGVDPEPRRSGISVGDQVDLNGLEEVGDQRRQLQAGDP